MKPMTRLSRVALAALLGLLTAAAPTLAEEKPKFFEQVAEVSVKVEPAEARPGQTVTWSGTVTPIPGWHTYPTEQAPDSENASTVNKFVFEKAQGPGQFVGTLNVPPYRDEVEPDSGARLRFYDGPVTFSRPFQVAKDAKSGDYELEVPA